MKPVLCVLRRLVVGMSVIVALGVAKEPDLATAADGQVAAWDVMSDTWAATDALGRSLPTFTEVGAVRPNKTVGVFYFLWLGRHGTEGPFDISKILAKDPTALFKADHPSWGPMNVPHHWGESIFDYYVSDDEGVLRKHAQMLGDAGVDVVIFDVTNQLTYPESWKALCRVFDEVRRAGNRVPQIAFLCPFGDPRKVVGELWQQLYSKNICPELWFRWEGKPLILADPAAIVERTEQTPREVPVELLAGHTLGQSFTAEKEFIAIGAACPTWNTTKSGLTLTLYRESPGGAKVVSREATPVADNSCVFVESAKPLPVGKYYLEISSPQGKIGWWGSAKDVYSGGAAFADGKPIDGDRTIRVKPCDDSDEPLHRFFTFRKPQPDYFTGPRSLGEWGWLEVHPQHPFCKTPGVPEMMTVGVAQNAVEGKLSVLSNPKAHGRSFHNGKEPPAEGCDTSGRNFAEQFGRAMEVDPPFLFITGWNEWIASRFDDKAPFHAPGPVTFVDQFNQEFSRDIEPMKGGHGDNYYYQLADYIRRYKGVREPAAVKPQPIGIDGRFDDWQKVEPEFRDTIGDPACRDHVGWDGKTRYVNRSGRNDIVAAKVSYDAGRLWFYVRTREAISPATDSDWMMLYLDTDNNPKTGWLGYDFVINRSRTADDKATLERNLGGKYAWETVGEVEFRVAGSELELAAPRAALGPGEVSATIDFKWADNIRQTGEWSAFTLFGDAAPNDRFNFRAIMKP